MIKRRQNGGYRAAMARKSTRFRGPVLLRDSQRRRPVPAQAEEIDGKVERQERCVWMAGIIKKWHSKRR
jgi:hypothetical protein